MALRAVVFDLFDTLVDLSMEDLPRVKVGGRVFPTTLGALHALVDQHRPIDLEDFASALFAVDRELREARAAEGRELPTLERFEGLAARLDLADPDLPRLLTERHMSLIRGQVTCPEHHPALLAALHGRVQTAVCSNFSHAPTALQVLEEAALDPHLDAVLVSETVGYRKPRREIFEATLAALGVAPAETLHVGDSLRADVAGAAALGLRTAWITRRVADPAKALAAHEGPAPDLVVADLAELLEAVAD
jgi:FMN phosphatase YigB (HAD superfamily)